MVQPGEAVGPSGVIGRSGSLGPGLVSPGLVLDAPWAHVRSSHCLLPLHEPHQGPSLPRLTETFEAVRPNTTSHLFVVCALYCVKATKMHLTHSTCFTMWSVSLQLQQELGTIAQSVKCSPPYQSCEMKSLPYSKIIPPQVITSPNKTTSEVLRRAQAQVPNLSTCVPATATAPAVPGVSNL